MNVKQLKEFLSQFPDDMPVKLRHDRSVVMDFTEENTLHTSETAFIDSEAPEEEWDTEDGKFCLGDGPQYLLINPLIL